MKSFEFSVIASALDPEAAGFADRFFDAGCDDATISFQKGHITADFARDAKSIDAALASAVAAVKKAGASVDRIEPDPLVRASPTSRRVPVSPARRSRTTPRVSAAPIFLRRSRASHQRRRSTTGRRSRPGFTGTTSFRAIRRSRLRR